MKPFLYLCVFAIVLIQGSCTEEPQYSLSSTDKQIVDSLYKERITEIRPVEDSICDANFERRVLQTVDSLLEIRRKEIAKHVKRLEELKK